MANLQLIRSHSILKQLSCFLILALLCNLTSLQQQLQKKSVGHSERTKIYYVQPKPPTTTIIIPTTRTIQQVPYKNYYKQNTFQSSELIRKFLSGKNRQNFNKIQYSGFAALISSQKSKPNDQEYSKGAPDNTSKLPFKGKFKVFRSLRYKGISIGDPLNSFQCYLHITGQIAPILNYTIKDLIYNNHKTQSTQVLRYPSSKYRNTNISCNHISISGLNQITPYFLKQLDLIQMDQITTNLATGDITAMTTGITNNNQNFNINIIETGSTSMDIDHDDPQNTPSRKALKRSADTSLEAVTEEKHDAPMDQAPIVESSSQMKWGEVMRLLEPARDLHPIMPDIAALKEALAPHKPLVDVTPFLEERRTYYTALDTKARQDFDKLALPKGKDEPLTPQEVQLVTQFVKVMRHELTRITMEYHYQETDIVLKALQTKSPSKDIISATNMFYAEQGSANRYQVQAFMNAILPTELTNQDERGQADDEYDQQLLLYKQILQQVSPDTYFEDTSMNISEQEPFEWSDLQCALSAVPDPPAGILSTAMSSPEAKLEIPEFYNSYQPIPSVQQTTGFDVVHAARSSETRDFKVKDTYMARQIEERTMLDKTYRWTQYVAILGFKPEATAEKSHTKLQAILNRVGAHADEPFVSGITIDLSFVISMHRTEAWKSKRYRAIKNVNTCYYIKLSKQYLFGTFYVHRPPDDAIYPAVSRMSVGKGPYYTVQCLPEPINLGKLQQPIKYPPIFALRGIPINKDRHALTSALLFAVELMMYTKGKLKPGYFTIIPTLVYHPVSSDDLRTQNFKLSQGGPNTAELIWEVIFLCTEDNITDGSKSERYLKCRSFINELIPPTSVSPHILHFSGFQMELLESVFDCLAHPGRSSAYTASDCTIFHHMPQAMLARDLLMHVSRNIATQQPITAIENAILLPPVPRTQRPLSWRLLIIWGGAASMGTANFHVTDFNFDGLAQGVTVQHPLLPGYETQFNLQMFYATLAASDVYITESSNNETTVGKPGSATNISTSNKDDQLKLHEIYSPITDTPTRASTAQTGGGQISSASLADNHDTDGTLTTSWPARHRGLEMTPWNSGRGGRNARIDNSTTVSLRHSNITTDTSPTSTMVIKEQPNLADVVKQIMSSELQRQIDEKMGEMKEQLMQAINAQVTDTQLASQVQILKQRSENLATQIRKYNKHKAKLDQRRAITSPEQQASFQADMVDLEEEFNVINATYKSISTDAKNLNQSLKSIGLPDFLQGPA